MEVVRAMVVVVMKHALSKHKQKEINYPIHKETLTMRSKEKKHPIRNGSRVKKRKVIN